VTKEAYLANLRVSRQALLDAVNAANESALETVAVCGTWTARQVLSHVAACDAVALNAAQQARSGATITWAWDSYGDGDKWNQDEVAKRQGLPLAALLGELQQTRNALLAELESWPAEGGPFGDKTWSEENDIGWIASHEREHADNIKVLSQ
jgi:uncharacterized damage-inducible protein DinB